MIYILCLFCFHYLSPYRFILFVFLDMHLPTAFSSACCIDQQLHISGTSSRLNLNRCTLWHLLPQGESRYVLSEDQWLSPPLLRRYNQYNNQYRTYSTVVNIKSLSLELVHCSIAYMYIIINTLSEAFNVWLFDILCILSFTENYKCKDISSLPWTKSN